MTDERGIGDNKTLSASDRRKLFAHHFRSLLADEHKKREAASGQKSTKKLAKSQDETFTAQKFDHYMKNFFAEDDQKPVDRFKSDRENLAWLGLIPDTEGKDLLGQIDRVDREGMIRAKGYEAGLMGLDKRSGYDDGSVDDVMWRDSYDAGREEYEADIPDIMARIQAKVSKEEPEASGEDPFPAQEAAE